MQWNTKEARPIQNLTMQSVCHPPLVSSPVLSTNNSIFEWTMHYYYLNQLLVSSETWRDTTWALSRRTLDSGVMTEDTFTESSNLQRICRTCSAPISRLTVTTWLYQTRRIGRLTSKSWTNCWCFSGLQPKPSINVVTWVVTRCHMSC